MTYDHGDYAAMMTDPVRGAAYLAAVRELVRPGCVVADVGAGPGLLGVYAAVLGARRVFLVEPGGALAAAHALAADNGVADRIEVLAAMSTEVELPERADVIISDLRGVLPFFGSHLQAAADMRARMLAPGGACVPLRDTLQVAALDDDLLHARTVRAWSGLEEHLRIGALERVAAGNWSRTHARADQLLTVPQQWAVLDYAALREEGRDGAVRSVVLRDGTVHGLLSWFDAALTPSITFSNGPASPKAIYGQAFFPLGSPLTVRTGDVTHIRMRAVRTGVDHQFVWSIRIERDGALVGSARHSTLEGAPELAAALTRVAPRRVPPAPRDAAPLQLLIEAMDGHASIATIASRLRQAFPARFPTPDSAMVFIARYERVLLP